jgi:hypothetical protein
MRICFLNTQRLGGGTYDIRRRRLITQAKKDGSPLMLLCELTGGCTFPLPYNLTYRRHGTRQLRYGAAWQGTTTLPIHRINPAVGPAYTNPLNNKPFYPGGRNFRTLADRAVGQVIPPATVGAQWPGPAGGLGGVDIYVFHAPASAKALNVIAFLACSFEAAYGPGAAAGLAPYYLVVGDMNVQPQTLLASPVFGNGATAARVVSSGGWTFYSRDRATGPTNPKEYDYAISNIPGLTVATRRSSKRIAGSDHRAIYLRY